MVIKNVMMYCIIVSDTKVMNGIAEDHAVCITGLCRSVPFVSFVRKTDLIFPLSVTTQYVVLQSKIKCNRHKT